MTAWTTPHTFVPLEVPTANEWNATVSDNLLHLYQRIRGGPYVGNSDVNGVLTIPHGLTQAPDFAVATWRITGVDALDEVAVAKISNVDATNILVRVYRTDTNLNVGVQNCSIGWIAGFF